jgi:hypothetical protein
MDQSSTRRKCTPVRYLGKGRLMGGRGVIFPGSYRGAVMTILARMVQVNQLSQVNPSRLC